MYSKKLRDIREEKEIKQLDIMHIINVKNSTYSMYETEKDIIPIKHLNTLCNYLDISLDYVFEFNDVKKYDNFKSEIDKKESGKRLKEFRKEKKLTQNKLADILNTTHSTITDYERGRYYIATPFLYTICKKYKISADYLLGKIESPKYLK